MTFTVSPADSGKRIDKLLSDLSGITRARIQRLIDEGLVLHDGKPAKANQKSRENAFISVTQSATEPSNSLEPEDIAVEIIYRDSHIVVVDKPAGLVVYPAAGHPSGTLMNALLFKLGRLASVGGPLRPGVVHRLDKDTSGLLVVALTDEAYYALVKSFADREVEKTYYALVYGSMKGERGEISLAIGRSQSDRKKMSTQSRRPKGAETSWEVVESYKGATLLRVKIKTGRTHQIRVHLSALGHSILGDEVYGRKTRLGDMKFHRQMLHAGRLAFNHPITGERMTFESQPPEDMRKAIEAVKIS